MALQTSSSRGGCRKGDKTKDTFKQDPLCKETEMTRKSWLDDDMQSSMIDDYAKKLGTFASAIADGLIEANELAAQEKRVVDIMKRVEPKLDDALHDEVTKLLCELSAFNTMQTLHEISAARPKTRFRG